MAALLQFPGAAACVSRKQSAADLGLLQGVGSQKVRPGNDWVIEERHIAGRRRAHLDYVKLSSIREPLVHWGPMDTFLQSAIAEARKGADAGGVPIGSVLVIENVIVGRGHNQRRQQGSVILHAEMDCLENAGRLTAADYRKATLYSTLSPCDMCSGAILLYRIPKLVIGENATFKGPEDYLRSRGVTLLNANSEACRRLMSNFIESNPSLWNEDIGEP
jgi:cytosine deaminase